METRDQRAAARFPVSLRAALNSGDDRSDLDFTVTPKQGQRTELISGDGWFPCRLLDMSDRGFSLVCNKTLTVGQILGLRLELSPDNLVECKLEIRHASETGSGGTIVEIDEEGIRLCKLFLQEHQSDKLKRKR